MALPHLSPGSVRHSTLPAGLPILSLPTRSSRADWSRAIAFFVLCEFFDWYSLTIARWLTTLPEQRATVEIYTTPRDVTPRDRGAERTDDARPGHDVTGQEQLPESVQRPDAPALQDRQVPVEPGIHLPLAQGGDVDEPRYDPVEVAGEDGLSRICKHDGHHFGSSGLSLSRSASSGPVSPVSRAALAPGPLRRGRAPNP